MSGSARTALIVGAGIGGLAAGLALKKAGWTVRVFERAPVARELGFGIALASYAVAALDDLGVVDRVLAQAATADSLAAATGGRLTAEIRRTDGRVLRQIVFHRNELPPIKMLPAVVLRPVLHGTLLEALGSEHVETGSEAVGVEQHANGVELRLAGGRSVSGDVLIGADGVASAIRRQLHPGEAPPHPSGYFALRGVSPAVALLDGRQFVLYLGRGIEIGVVPASETSVYWYLSLLADDVRRGPREVRDVLRRVTAGFDPRFSAITAAATDMRLDELFARPPLARWGHGRVTLLGDAAHPVLPHTGQGAAQALVDAVALGRSLAANGNPADGLRRYEAGRVGAARQVVLAGPRIARLTTTRNPVIGALRTATIRLTPMPVLRRAFVNAPKSISAPAAAGQRR